MLDTVGPAGHQGVVRNTEGASVLGALFVKLVELGPHNIGVVIGLIRQPEQPGVVQLRGVRHAQQLAGPHLDGNGLVVEFPVRLVHKPRFGQQVRRPVGVRGSRAGLTLELHPGEPFEILTAGKEELFFLFLGIGRDVTGVVEAVVHENPVPLQHGLGDLREMLQDAHAQGG